MYIAELYVSPDCPESGFFYEGERFYKSGGVVVGLGIDYPASMRAADNLGKYFGGSQFQYNWYAGDKIFIEENGYPIIRIEIRGIKDAPQVPLTLMQEQLIALAKGIHADGNDWNVENYRELVVSLMRDFLNCPSYGKVRHDVPPHDKESKYAVAAKCLLSQARNVAIKNGVVHDLYYGDKQIDALIASTSSHCEEKLYLVKSSESDKNFILSLGLNVIGDYDEMLQSYFVKADESSIGKLSEFKADFLFCEYNQSNGLLSNFSDKLEVNPGSKSNSPEPL